jgi:hypothetical protein
MHIGFFWISGLAALRPRPGMTIKKGVIDMTQDKGLNRRP